VLDRKRRGSACRQHGLLDDRDGAVGVLFGLLLPVLVLAVAFGIDVAGWYRDALQLQGIADRVAMSAGPLWRTGDRAGALQIAGTLAADVTIDHVGRVSSGKRAAQADAFEIIVSSPQHHMLAGLVASQSQSARAVAIGYQLVE
jgi:hypothetical protein